MRLVAAAAAFLLGAAAALGFDLAPGLKIPAAAFYLLLAASIIGVSGALLAGRRLGIALLVLIALLGMWRGGHAAAVDVGDRWFGAPETSGLVTIEGELLTDPAPANSNTRIRLDVVASTVNGRRSETFFKADVFADRLADVGDSGTTGRPVNGFRYGDRYIVSGPYEPSAGSGEPVAGRISVTTVVLIGDDAGNPSADGSHRCAKPWPRPSNVRRAEQGPIWVSH